MATQGDAFTGMSELYPSKADADFHTGLTGVRREARRKGVALAMKVRGIEFAKRHGASAVRTWNASHNPNARHQRALRFSKTARQHRLRQGFGGRAAVTVDQRGYSDTEPFAYQKGKDGRIFLFWEGKRIKILKGKEGRKIL